MEGYTDADWAGSITDKVNLRVLHLCWRQSCYMEKQKQPVVARSSAEVEFRSMANDIYELLWIQGILCDLRLSIQAPM